MLKLHKVGASIHSVSALGTVLLLTPPAAAQTTADFYRGKTITISVGLGPGGGYDRHARTLARHIGKHIPGNPAVVVKNVPGAGGLVLANALYNIAPKDGTEFGTFSRSIPLDPLLGNPQARFDPLKFLWLGSTSNEINTCVAWHTAPVKNIDDLKKLELLVAGTGPLVDTVIYPTLLNAITGTKFKIVQGYKGSADALLAMENGETQGFCAWGWVTMNVERPDWVRERKVIPLVQFGLRKHPDHPDTPLAQDLAATLQDRQAIELVVSPLLFARPFAAPPGLPTDRAAALRSAFEAAVKDPEFIAEADKQKLEPELVTGVEIDATLSRLYKTPKAVIDRVKNSIN